jgi:carbon starvation protein
MGFSAQVVSVILSGFMVAAFAMTTLDTTNGSRVTSLRNDPNRFERKIKYSQTVSGIPGLASLIPAALGIALAWTGSYNVLWPAFGGANQMLASIALITVAAWVIQKRKRVRECSC